MIYTYRCNACNEVFPTEIRLSQYVTNGLKIICPKCSSKDVRRSFQEPINVHYVGDDFTKSVKQEEK